MSRTSQKLAIQPVQNAPSRPPPFRLSPLPLLVGCPSSPACSPSNHRTALATLTSAVWFNLISPRAIRPLTLWVDWSVLAHRGRNPITVLLLWISFDVVYRFPPPTVGTPVYDSWTVDDWIEYSTQQLSYRTLRSTLLYCLESYHRGSFRRPLYP
jgi:hypothetical protein